MIEKNSKEDVQALKGIIVQRLHLVPFSSFLTGLPPPEDVNSNEISTVFMPFSVYIVIFHLRMLVFLELPQLPSSYGGGTSFLAGCSDGNSAASKDD
jgi:hypothetical protein